jgi:hypothetical protein
VSELFDLIEKRLQEDTAPGARSTYARAVFHSEDGRPLRCVHRIMGTRERVEVTVVQFRRAGEKGDTAPGRR